MDLAFYSKAKGLYAEQLSGEWELLKDSIDAGYPVIVFVDHGIFPIQVNHFMVVIGYSNDRVIVHSGKNKEKIEKKRKFLRTWKKNHYWMLLIKPEKSSP